MSAHSTQRRISLVTVNHQSHIRSTTRPHAVEAEAEAEASMFQVTLLIICILLLMALVLGLVYSCLRHFQFFRNLIDPEARKRYNADRDERNVFMAGREIGSFARGFGKALSSERSLLCDRSGYLGGGRGYGWRTGAYGDGNVDDGAATADTSSGYQTLVGWKLDRRSSNSTESILHRDDCEAQCGLTSRRGSRSRIPE